MEQGHGDNQIKISVVIPVYNAAGSIEQTIDSVLAQSYPAHEIIVVDDASKDNTAELVQNKYAGKIQFIQKLTNQGSAATRNKGMDAATGNYIAFLDTGALWHKDKLMLLNTVLVSQPGITLFYHPFAQENIIDKELPESITVYKLPFVKLLPGNFIATSCIVIKNNAAFRFNTEMRYMEDFDLCLRIGYKYKLYFVKIPLTQIVRPFTSAGGISANEWKKRKEEMRAYQRLVRLNPLFVGLVPFLLVSSLGKHLLKMILPKS